MEDALRAARNAVTGAPSDRQELEAPEEPLPGMGTQDKADEAQTEADLVENSYPGREYRLSYAAGETVKFLEITPKYSEAADGDCNLVLMLKDEPLEYFIDRNFNDRPVVITDEAPRTSAVISMAAEEAVAENGSVRITVLREGRINDTVSVMLNSADGTALQDEDYGGVGAKLTFPHGRHAAQRGAARGPRRGGEGLLCVHHPRGRRADRHGADPRRHPRGRAPC